MCDLNGCGNQADLPPMIIDPQQRRLFLKGMTSLPLAAVLSSAELANAAAATLQTVTLEMGVAGNASAALALPDNPDNAPCVILIHEWWGLNDQIKAVAAELAKQGYLALAVDLYGGKVGTNRDEAMALIKALDGAIATETMRQWVDFMRNHPRGNGKVATMGWCFGGGWSLNTSITTPVDATVIYYGRVNKTADQLANLNSPVLGHFGTLDKNINQAMVTSFEQAMTDAGKAEALSVHWYEADHAFANPTGARYDQEDAALAWDRTLAFLQQHLS